MSQLTYTVGAGNGSGTAFYALDFSQGPTFTNVVSKDLVLTGGPLTTNESGTSATFSLQLSAQPSATVTVTLTGLDATEGSLSTTTLTFTTANWNSPQIVTVTGVNDVILDGNITYTITATSSSSDAAFNGRTAVIDITNIDNDVSVNNISVNENSPFAVFSVSGTGNQPVTLGLQNDADGATNDAALGTDTGTQIQYFNGSTWVNYSSGTVNLINGSLLVRVAINDDSTFEGPETFQLAVTPTGGALSTGTATINDDGTGNIYPDNNTGNTDPGALKDDDRAVSVNNISVNENSPFAVFSVSGTGNQPVTLALQNDADGATNDAALGTDTGTQIQYFNGSTWVNYTSGTVDLINGSLLVRVAINDDSTFEGPETFQLAVTPTGGALSTGTATINDDGTGNIYPDNNTGNTDPGALKDDDRAVSVNNISVNENSPFAVFTVSGTGNQPVTLGLQNDADGATNDAALGTDTGTQIQYFNGSTWVNYTSGTVDLINGSLLVRVAINDDSTFEGPETFQLAVTPTGGALSTGTATINDDGTGNIYPDNNTGNTDPGALKDDDRAVSVNNISVNENSPFAVFTVSGTGNQPVTLGLQNDADGATNDAALGTDTGTQIQYFNGSTWVNYSSGTVNLINGSLLVRVAINDDSTFEGPETFQLAVTPTGGALSTGTATINDDGTGNIYPDNNTGNTDPGALKDDDRAVSVNNISVNENSPFAVFSVSGTGNQPVTLALQNDADGATNDAALGTDTGTQIQYFNGSTWVNYTSGTVDLINGSLLVRVAINDDSTFEGPETFQLAVTPTGGALSTGTATINDDGTGNIYPDNNTGNTDPGALKDDDRAVSVNNISVNENSPFAVFTVSGTGNQPVTLALQNDADGATNDAALGTDTGTQIQYFNGSTWVNYSSGTVDLINGSLLVRVAINDDSTFEGPETFQLAVTPTGGALSTGTATINDDGTGNIYPDNNTGNTDPGALKDDDRAVSVNNISVNENSPFAVFTVSGTGNQPVTLGLQNDADGATNDAALGTDTGTQIQYFNGSTWVNYSSGTVDLINGSLLVRVAINDDSTFEGPETFQLAVTPTGGALSTGTATINDDGTGNIYPDNNTGNTDPGALKDDDRAVSVNNISVNENSPFAVFTVSGTGNQPVTLGLQNDADGATNDAALGTDTGTQIQYFNGSTWVNYTSGTVDLINGSLLVRVAINDDSTFEGPETFQLAVTPTGGALSTGTATINDDGTGNIYPDNNTGNTDPGALKDDDRAVSVNNISVNENSPFAVFSVSGTGNQPVTLGLQNDADGATNDAALGTDTGTQIQYFNGSTWVNYSSGTVNLINGSLLVRVAINDDSTFEGPETFQLAVTPTGGALSTGTATINDDGTGNIYPDNNTGNTDPGALKDDDRAVSVNNISVNENSPFAVFSVSGTGNQPVTLGLQNDADGATNDAALGTDTGTQIQYFNGSTWVNYSSGTVNLINGSLLVRVAINDDSTFEGPETFQLAVTPTGGALSTGTATINDDGTGNIYPDNNTGNTDPGALKDDDRAVSVNNISVNENSPFAVFTVSGTGNQPVTLGLQNDADGATNDAALGTDTGTQIQYFNGSTWVNYTSGTVDLINGSLLVRVAINDDSTFEGPETFQLAVTPTGGALSTGTATINDDGTGNIYPDNNTGNTDPGALKDDDRAVSVNNISVNENSPFAVFSVSGTGNQPVTLGLQNDADGATNDAALGTDTGTQIQYFNGSTWVNYSSGTVNLINGSLLVRVAINDDSTFEGPETFQLAVTPTGGALSTGTATINDDGTGNIYPDNNTGNTDPGALKDDDRAVSVNNISVNENSPFAVFSVSGTGNQPVTLALQNDADGATNDAALGTDTGTQIQYFNGSTWVNYTSGTVDLINGSLLVRVAINDDSTFEGPETFQLAVTPTGGALSTGTATINDDGTGNIYPDNNTGNTDPGALKDDDRAVSVNNISVNENSPFAVFTVSGTGNQPVTLGLQNDADGATNDAALGTDTGTQIQYFNGSTWVNYSSGTVNLINGSLLVRVAINDDSTFEGPETFQLAVTPTGGALSTGTATINDDGTGNIYPDNNTGNTDPGALKDDDRAVSVNNISVNENSPFAVFSVSGTGNQPVTLGLQNDADGATNDAALGTDTGTQIQYFNGSTWVNYSSGTVNLINGSLLVRVAINDDSTFEGPETFQLAVTPTGGALSTGTATINDDGTGNIYPDNNTGNTDPGALKDDDRAVSVNNISVNENSPFAVFTVSGTGNQPVTLGLQNDADGATNDAALGTDTGTQIQYFNGSTWVNYSSGTVDLINGSLLVRVAINDDSTFEGPETFQLAVTPTGGALSTGTATINDDGTGNIYPDNNTGNTDPGALKDDDRAVSVNNISVNENSPFAVFTVSGTGNQPVTLGLQNDADGATNDAALGTDTGTQIQYFNGSTWVNYTSGTVDLINGSLLVRVAINDDSTFEGPETFQLAVTPTGGALSTGTATINDDGTGNIYPDNNTGNTDPGALKDDDRAVSVNNISVNENSPFAVFSVSGTGNQPVTLGLQNDADGATNDAALGTDTGTQIQYFNGSTWVNYSSGTVNLINGSLLVRVAINDDSTFEGPETFQLAVTPTGGALSTGTATINDDGTGNIYPDNNTGNTDPGALKDDDRAVSVNNISVNENSPFAVFSVSGTGNQPVTLGLQNDADGATNDAALGTDTGTQIQYFNGSTWVNYSSGTVNLINGSLLVRVAINDDSTFEGPETFQLAVTPTGGALSTGTATINDDGTGNIYPDNNTGNTDPGALKDDDRAVSVNNISVNENSPFAVFTVSGTGNQPVTLGLQNDADGATNDAALGTDTGTQIQYFNGSTWVNYTSGTVDLINGSLLVRVAINDDSTFEGPETFQLAVTPTGGALSTGTATINDDGTGNIYPDNNTGNTDPGALKDDDRAVSVNNISVNENSPFAVFSVSGTGNQPVTLGLQNDADGATNDAALGTDTGTQIQYFNGSTWVNYSSGTVNLINGSLLVRVAINDDSTFEGPETFQLAVTPTGGALSTGTATINDDGTGNIYPDNNTGNTDPGALKDDDRAVSVNNISVNENSPFAVFSVSGTGNQPVTLALQNDADGATNDAALGTDTGTQIQYFNGSTWVNYTSGTVDLINGSLLVRVAINDDSTFEGPETFQLAVTPTGGALSTGTATINDDGTGNIYPDNNTGNTDPGALKDDDRAVSVNNISVNENSPFAVFTVSGTGNQPVTLGLQNDADGATNDAALGTDTGTQIQYFNGSTWVNYSSGTVNLINGSLLVRVAINDDSTFEGPETFQLAVTPTGGALSTGTATINDDGTGNIYPDNNTGNTDPGALKDDDRAVSVNNISVNENSPFAVFSVSGTGNQPVTLGLQNDADGATNDAALGTDTGTQIQYFNGSTWVNYSSGTVNLINGSLLVRVAINDDSTFEGPETFQLAVTPTGGALSTGTATINDDGTGNIYPDNNTGNTDPGALKDDDRAVSVNNISVNENSPFAVFSVSGTGNQPVTLALQNDADGATNDAALGTDTGTQIQYFNGSTWVNYSSGTVDLINGSLLVRVAINDDSTFEGPETFQLAVTPTGGALSTGTATINDDGTGNIYPDNNTGNTDPGALKDDDRAVSVNNISVNENSPFAVFTVSGTGNQPVTLGLQNDADGATNDAALGTDTGTQIQYFNGSTWVNYTSGTVDLINGSLLVRVAINDDSTFEGPETFQLAVTPTGGALSTGTATINDDGTGNIYPDNNTGNTDPGALKDDDRAVSVNNISVNENSPFAVFSVSGTGNQPVTLGLQNDADGATNDAALGTDTGTQIQYFNGSTWVNYTSGTVDLINGSLLVRVAINDDSTFEGPETFQLAVTPTGGALSTGTATINDDGTGNIYPDNNTGNTDPGALKDDDRAVSVNNISVNENSPFAVFTVSGTGNQPVTLGLQNDADGATNDAALGTDTGTQIQYFNGSTWVNYTSGTVDLINGSLLVRVAINDDSTFEGPETFQLAVTPTGGALSTGTATINDDGTGNIYPDNNTGNTDPGALKDDDRAVSVNNISVNENSPFAVFTVSGTGNQPVTLGLQNDADGATNDAALGTDTGTQIQYFNGSTWVNYTSGTVDLINGSLLVRVAINDDSTFEGPETFQLAVTPTGGALSTGTATINDDGTGNIYPDNNTGNTDPGALKDDDRAVSVNNISVNENSPFAVFSVSGTGNQPVTLGLQNDADGATNDAALGTDTGTQIQYFNGSTWVNYTSGTVDLINGSLLVRVAINDDSTFEGPETFQLAVTPTGGALSTGTATINDDGTGNIYPDNNTGNTDPGALKDDDRAVSVNNISVNENSPFAVFSVSGTGNQPVTLGLQNDADGATNDAALGTDTGTQIQYFNGSTWVNYSSGTVNLINGSLLVRVAINDDSTFEGPETFQLAVTPTGGALSTGTATINDDGTGNIYPDNNTGNTDPGALKDDDRGPAILVPTNDGTGLEVIGTEGDELWVDLSVVLANALKQNGLDLVRISSDGSQSRVGSIGATPDSGFLGDTRVKLAVGDQLQFIQVRGNLPANDSPALSISSDGERVIVRLDDNSDDNDFNDLVLKVKTSTFDPFPQSTKLAKFQQASDQAYLDLSWISANGIMLSMDVTTESDFNNRFGLVKVDTDVNGTPLGTVGGLAPSAGADFDEAVRRNLLSFSYTQSGKQTVAGLSVALQGSQAGVYAPVLITPTGAIYTFGASSSSDQKQHIKVLGANSFGFEDLPSGSADWDFNDAVITFQATNAEPPKLVISSDGQGLTVVAGTGQGTGLWLDLNAVIANSALQNSFDLVKRLANGQETSIGSVGATAQATFLGGKELFLGVGETLRFVQNSNDDNENVDPALRIEKIGERYRVSLDDNGDPSPDSDFNDLIVDVDSTPLDPFESVVSLASQQRTSSDGILDLTNLQEGKLTLNLSIVTDSENINTLSFVKLDVDPVTGKPLSQVAGVSASEGEAFRTAVRDNLVDFSIAAGGQAKSLATWEVGASDSGYYAAVVVSFEGNLFTLGDTTAADGRQHLKVFGDNSFGFEDLLSSGGADWDYNDLIVTVTPF
ncbi:beta strand repeat-containing protein [Cyanobium sp. ULC065]